MIITNGWDQIADPLSPKKHFLEVLCFPGYFSLSQILTPFVYILKFSSSFHRKKLSDWTVLSS